MSAALSGPPGIGSGPTPLSSLFSDRAHEEFAGGGSMGVIVDPLSRALRTLDSISGTQLEARDGVRTAVEAPSRPVATSTSTRREEILDSASALFAERGYHGASLRDISRRVGISHPGMLHHFSSKEVLLAGVIDRLEAHAQGLLDSVEALQNSRQALLAALVGPWDPREHPMALLSTLSAEIVNPDHPGRFRIARLRLVHENVLEQVLEGHHADGRLIEGTTPRVAARILFSLLLSLTVREHTIRELQNGSGADPIADVQEFVRHLLRE